MTEKPDTSKRMIIKPHTCAPVFDEHGNLIYRPLTDQEIKVDPETQGSTVCGFCCHYYSIAISGFKHIPKDARGGGCSLTMESRWYFDIKCKNFCATTGTSCPHSIQNEINFIDDEDDAPGDRGC